MRHRWLVSVASLAVVLGGAHRADATAIYYADARAVIEFVGLDHVGGGVGVIVYADYIFMSPYAWEQSTGDGEAYQSWGADLMATRVEVSAHAEGSTTDGTALSLVGVEGLIWVENSSAYDATAYFRVTGALRTEADITGNSVGRASSYASIMLSSSTGEVWGGVSVESFTLGGPDASSRTVVPDVYSITVPPGWGHYFSVVPYAEGYAAAVPSRVPEPLSSTLLAIWLAAGGLLRRRRRGPRP